MTDPLVSIIIPTYNRPEHVAAAVKNIQQQTYRPLEIIVVDDSSPTPVQDTVSDNIKSGNISCNIIRHRKNKGANAARNTGIRSANGEYIAFLDDDDRWRSTKIEEQVALMNQEAVGMVYAGCIWATPEGGVLTAKYPDDSANPTQDLLLKNYIGSFSMVLVKREVIEAVGGLDEEFPCWQDTDLFIRLSQVCDFDYVDELLTIRYFGADDQITGDFTVREAALQLFLDKHTETAVEFPNSFRNRMISHRYFNVGWSAVRSGNHRAGLRWFVRSVRSDPTFIHSYAGLAIAVGGPVVEKFLSRMNQLLSDNDTRGSPARIAEYDDGTIDVVD